MEITITNDNAYFTVEKCSPNSTEYGLYVLGWQIKTWSEKPKPEEVEELIMIIIRSWGVLSTSASIRVNLCPPTCKEIRYLDYEND